MVGPGVPGAGQPPPRPPWETRDVPTYPPQPVPPARAPRRAVMAGVLVFALLGWIGAAAVYGLQPTDLPRTTASAYVPPDAYRDAALFEQGDAQSQAMVENARVRRSSLRWAVSPFLFELMQQPPGVDEKDENDVLWWREATIPSTLDQPPRYRVFTATDDGIRLHGQDWGPRGMVLKPAPVVLPADVHAGQTWTSKGIGAGAGFESVFDYRASMRAEAAAGGCLRVTTTMQLTPQDEADAGAATRWAERNVWCEGQGIVESAGSLGDFAYTVSTKSGRPAEPRSDGVREVPLDAARIADWQHGTLTAQEGDETFGSVAMAAVHWKEPVETADGSIVYAAHGTTDVAGLLPVDSGKYWQHWWVRPGGQVLSLAAVGNTVVVTTSDRTMKAYAPGGRLLWSVALDDVVAAPPVRVGDDLLAVATERGVVSLRSAVDGHEVWTHRLPSGVINPLATDGSVIAAVDVDGILHVLDVRDGAKRWTADAATTANVVISGGTTVVGSTNVEAFDNDTGQLRWRSKPGLVSEVHATAGAVAVATRSGVHWLDLGTGASLGALSGASQPRPVGESWLVLAGDSLVATDRAGARLHTWQLSIPAEQRHVVVGSTRVWVFGHRPDDFRLTGEWVGPRG